MCVLFGALIYERISFLEFILLPVMNSRGQNGADSHHYCCDVTGSLTTNFFRHPEFAFCLVTFKNRLIRLTTLWNFFFAAPSECILLTNKRLIPHLRSIDSMALRQSHQWCGLMGRALTLWTEILMHNVLLWQTTFSHCRWKYKPWALPLHIIQVRSVHQFILRYAQEGDTLVIHCKYQSKTYSMFDSTAW